MQALFSKQDLKNLIIPLVIEQILAVSVGMTDIVVISSVSEDALSGVSLVNSINILLINIFTALATGGAVVAAQALGRHEPHEASKSANQLVAISTLFSIILTIFLLIGYRQILETIFGNVSDETMNNAITYFILTTLSFPFLSIYNSCAALFRAMGNSKVSMMTSLCMNLINIFGDILFVYFIGIGTFGAGVATLVSRIVASILITKLLLKPQNRVHIYFSRAFRFDWKRIKEILSIGVPNGLENSMFQVGKLLVVSLITTYGTAAIAANAVSNTIASIAVLPGMAIGFALITIVGQCVGAKDYDQAIFYTKKLMKMTYILLFVLNFFLFVGAPLIAKLYNLSSDTSSLVIEIIRYHSILCVLIWPISFTLPNALRAANDAKFTMVIAIISMWTCRIGFSYILGSTFGLGVFGVWIAMTLDWVFRSFFMSARFLKRKLRPKSTLA